MTSVTSFKQGRNAHVPKLSLASFCARSAGSLLPCKAWPVPLVHAPPYVEHNWKVGTRLCGCQCCGRSATCRRAACFCATLRCCTAVYDQYQIQYANGYGWLGWVPTGNAETVSVVHRPESTLHQPENIREVHLKKIFGTAHMRPTVTVVSIRRHASLPLSCVQNHSGARVHAYPNTSNTHTTHNDPQLARSLVEHHQSTSTTGEHLSIVCPARRDWRTWYVGHVN